MGEILVIAEHRQGELREITLQMLWKAHELCEKLSHTLTVVVLGPKEQPFLGDLIERADKVVSFEDESLTDFNSDLYREVLFHGLIKESRPYLTLIGQTPWGMDLGPSLAAKTGYPIATDCVDILPDNGGVKAIRQIYSGKIFSKVSLKESEGYLITVRPGAFPADKAGERKAELVKKDIPAELAPPRIKFMEYGESAAGELDICQADLLVSVGRGIGEQDNIPIVNELADLMGGMLSCSRPVVDKNWLPKYHQVGTSGKSVKPKVYLALGISGAFQHVAGLSGAGTIIAVNKDPKAPIFRVADYGVVDDLLKVVQALKEKIKG